MKTVFDGSQPGLESPILVSRGVINRVEVYDLWLHPRVEHLFKPPKVIGESKSINDLTEYLESSRGLNTNFKIMFSMLFYSL